MTVQELNRTPLSQAALKAAQSAYQLVPMDNSLYLVQALQKTLENNLPPENRQMYRTDWKVWEAMQDFLTMASLRNPQAVYKVMTEDLENEEPSATDSKLLQWMDKEKDPESKLQVLLANVEETMESNGLNLQGDWPENE